MLPLKILLESGSYEDKKLTENKHQRIQIMANSAFLLFGCKSVFINN